MLSYPTCRHIHENGTYCGSPALTDRSFCYYHLTHRARRLRRTLALSRNEPCPLVLAPLENLASVPYVLNEILQALAAGQLDQATAGKMLYAIQMASAAFARLAKMSERTARQAAENSAAPAPAVEPEPVTDYPELERTYGLEPNLDLDAEIDRVTPLAREQATALSVQPTPQPGSGCPVPPKPHYTREEAYQSMQWEISDLRKQVRELKQLHQQQLEFFKKHQVAAVPPAATTEPSKVG